MGTALITTFDIVYASILFFIILGYGNNIKKKHIALKSYYKNYSRGLIVKLFGGIIFCLIYAFYYKGGDTVNYYRGVNAMIAVFKESPITYLKLLLEDNTAFARNAYYEVSTYPPTYMLNDLRTYTVIKISSIFGLFGLGGFLSTTILVSTFIYNWVWKLYSFMAERYQGKIIAINIAVLYLPSTIFWGSGIMKDTFTFGASCYAIFGLQKIIIERKQIAKTILPLFFSFYLIITIKAYIIFALIPGLLIFANFERLKAIKSTLIKSLILPLSIGIIGLVANTLFFDFNELFGKYSADKILEEAAIQNADLQRDVYGSNSFNIGEFEPTVNGVLSKSLPAINAAIFRPYIWEAGSPTMIFSGIENTILLLLTFWVILTKPIKLLSSLKNDPFLIFCFLFTLILGFGIGLSTSNFGALVRYKIPFLPFFVFFILNHISLRKNKKN